MTGKQPNLAPQGGLFLVGFMGCGKTTVGQMLAHQLSRPFHDLDDAVTAAAGKSIPHIFKEDGEQVFRRYEREVLKTLPLNTIVALGGGAFIQEEIRRYISSVGLAIYLDWPFQVLLDRVSGDANRPLARDPKAMETLFNKRRPIYEGANLTWTSQPPHQETPRTITADLLELLSRNQPSNF